MAGKLSAIWNYKCPKCYQGDLYKKPLVIKDPLDMHKRCSECGFKYESEPGYFFGAMFVSYVWTAWTLLFIVGFCMLILKWSVTASFAVVIIVSILSYIMVLRLSRSIYLHLDNRYDPKAIEKHKALVK